MYILVQDRTFDAFQVSIPISMTVITCTVITAWQPPRDCY